MKLRTIAICALLAAAWCAGCGSVFNGAIDDMTMRQTGWFTILGGATWEVAYSVHQTSDGGYIIAGYTTSAIDSLQGKSPIIPYNGDGSYDMLIVKLDSSGNVVWFTFLGGAGSQKTESIQQTSDGGYIVAGDAASDITFSQGTKLNVHSTGTNKDMLVVKLDSSGNVAWYTFLGGTGGDGAYSLDQTSDGGCIVAGSGADISSLQGKEPLNAYSGGLDVLLVKLDAAGNVAWYTFLGGTGQDGAQSVEQTSDGGYIIAGNTAANIPLLQGKEPLNSFVGGIYDMLVIKLKNDGTL